MRLSPLFTMIAALLLAAALLAGAWVALSPSGPPLISAAVTPGAITPNADGNVDVARLTYNLRRPATLSIYFLDAQGRRFTFRAEKPRADGEHAIDFSGIVDPFTLPEEHWDGELLARVLPDGEYTWVVEAVDARGETNQVTGKLTVSQADTTLPELRNLSVSPNVFTPNQDGLNDRTNINVYLAKEVAEDGLHVVLLGPNGEELPIPESAGRIKPGEMGLHTFDYDGGIDLGANPPPDGAYTVRAEVSDRLGQKMVAAERLTIQNGGLPRAEIHLGQVEFFTDASHSLGANLSVALGQTLYFRLTVENYGASPIRTSGPPSGTVYDSMSTNANALGFYEESGAWRVGLDCDTCIRDYPWRWALGTASTLTPLDEDGVVHYYLLPDQRAVITGGIVLDQIVEARNPQYFWAGLIHEDVEVATVNNRVDPHFVTIEKP